MYALRAGLRGHSHLHLSKFDVDADSLTVGFIGDAGDAVDLLCLYKLRHLLDQSCLIDKVRKLCDDDMALSVRCGLDICHGADSDLSASGTVRLLNSSCSEDLSSCREIRSL